MRSRVVALVAAIMWRFRRQTRAAVASSSGVQDCGVRPKVPGSRSQRLASPCRCARRSPFMCRVTTLLSASLCCLAALRSLFMRITCRDIPYRCSGAICSVLSPSVDRQCLRSRSKVLWPRVSTCKCSRPLPASYFRGRLFGLRFPCPLAFRLLFPCLIFGHPARVCPSTLQLTQYGLPVVGCASRSNNSLSAPVGS